MVPETGLHSLTNVTGVRTGVRPQAIRAYRGTHASPRCSVQRPLGEENLNIHRDFALYSEPSYRVRSRLLFSPSGPTALPDRYSTTCTTRRFEQRSLLHGRQVRAEAPVRSIGLQTA